MTTKEELKRDLIQPVNEVPSKPKQTLKNKRDVRRPTNVNLGMNKRGVYPVTRKGKVKKGVKPSNSLNRGVAKVFDHQDEVNDISRSTVGPKQVQK